MKRPTLRGPIAALAFLLLAAAVLPARANDRIVFATDWLAQAEHGGFYQALAEGTYRKHGLDVTIRMGGPQMNGLQLLAAGQIDVAMADGLQALSAVEQNVPVVAIAATFQKNPTVLISHPGTTRIERSTQGSHRAWIRHDWIPPHASWPTSMRAGGAMCPTLTSVCVSWWPHGMPDKDMWAMPGPWPASSTSTPGVGTDMWSGPSPCWRCRDVSGIPL